MFKIIANFFKPSKESKELQDWYIVTWDIDYIYRNVSPPGQKAWSDQFRWVDIERICFEASESLYTDDIYFFTTKRPESYVVPIESKGGAELWQVILEKKLFDAELAIKAATSLGGIYCWPKENEKIGL